jgi:hypothetical protein
MHGNFGEIDDLNHTSALERILNQVDEAERKSSPIFMPDLNPLQMHYREEIILLLRSKGWKLKHWSVTGNPPFVCAYPVFVRFYV